MQQDMRMVCSHISSGWGASARFRHNLVLHRFSYSSKKHNLVRFGHENKNEKALARLGEREEICCLHGRRSASAHTFLYFGEPPSLRHSHSPHNDVTVSPRSGREGAERRGRLTPCAPLRHPESTQVWAALCHCQTDPTYTSPTPLPFETEALWAISKASYDARGSVL